MALAFDATSTASGQVVDTLSWSHTASGADRVVLVGVAWRMTSAVTVTGVTYGGVAMTSVGSQFHTASAANARMHLWRLVAPATGAQTITITMSGQVNDLIGGAVSFTGADQTTPVGTFASAEGNSTSPATVDVTSATGEIVVDTVCSSGLAVTLTAGAGQTQRWNSGIIATAIGAGSTEAGAATVTMSWTLNTVANWVIGAVSVKPVSAAGGVTYPQLERFGTRGIERGMLTGMR